MKLSRRLSVAPAKSKKSLSNYSSCHFGSADIDEEHPLYHEVFDLARHLHTKELPWLMAVVLGRFSRHFGHKAGNGKDIAVTFKPENMPEFEGRYSKILSTLRSKLPITSNECLAWWSKQTPLFVFRVEPEPWASGRPPGLMAHRQCGNHKPLVLYGKFWHQNSSQSCYRNFFIGEKEQEVYTICETPWGSIYSLLTEFEHQLADRCVFLGNQKMIGQDREVKLCACMTLLRLVRA